MSSLNRLSNNALPNSTSGSNDSNIHERLDATLGGGDSGFGREI